LLVLALGLLFAADGVANDAEAPTGDAVRNELQRLEGVWVPVAVEADGKKIEGEALKRPEWRDLPFSVKDGKMSLSVQGKTHPTDLQIGLTRKPKTMDCIFTEAELKGTVDRRLYRLDGDILTICCDTVRPTQRPAAFSSRGTLMIVTYQRVKP
jgi:uncharacterized protein (TIGR03067 family)